MSLGARVDGSRQGNRPRCSPVAHGGTAGSLAPTETRLFLLAAGPRARRHDQGGGDRAAGPVVSFCPPPWGPSPPLPPARPHSHPSQRSLAFSLTELLSKLRENQLPRIQAGDPVARYFGIKRGQVRRSTPAPFRAGAAVTPSSRGRRACCAAPRQPCSLMPTGGEDHPAQRDRGQIHHLPAGAVAARLAGETRLVAGVRAVAAGPAGCGGGTLPVGCRKGPSVPGVSPVFLSPPVLCVTSPGGAWRQPHFPFIWSRLTQQT